MEATLLNIIRNDDISAFSDGRQPYTATVLNIKTASASDIGCAYEQSSDTANEQFLGKRILVSGTVEAVQERDQASSIILFANTGSVQVRALAPMDTAARLKALYAGSSVALVCVGLGGATSAATFGDCEFANDFAQRTWDRLSTEFSDFYQGKPAKSIAIPMMAIKIAQRASLMSLDRPCSDDPENCFAAAMSLGNFRERGNASALQAVIARFKSAGLDLSLFSRIPINP
ncbi:OB-fold protein [Ralstonia sp. UBA689]|uniref:OB-fold protein n=1 Tax=Ralstonia sp. UBA689 TaxID=1947373 RepID=UPI0039C91D66